MKQQQKDRPLGVTMIVILTIIDGIAVLTSRIAALTIAPFLLDVDINDNNVPPATETSTLGSVTIPETLLVGMSVVTGIYNPYIRYRICCYSLRIVKKERMGLNWSMGSANFLSTLCNERVIIK